MEERTRLVMVFGGESAEHDVSRVTATHVMAAADSDKYDVELIAITREGTWVRPRSSDGDLEAVGDPVEPWTALVGAERRPSVVFPLLHGPMGEDGTVQGLFELTGLPYVGSGVLGSALGMDKAKAKEVLEHHDIPQAGYVSGYADRLDVDDVAHLGFPLFVKPANLGSSVGVSKASDAAELRDAIEIAGSYDRLIVVEEAIDGREIEVAVLGNDDLRVSVPGEIVPGADFYDYADKYLNDDATLIVPAELPVDAAELVEQLAVQAFRALRAEGLARVDLFYEPGGRVLINEVNTMPGFTPISMYPRLWEASGISYPELIDELVALAKDRRRHRERHRRTDRR